MQGQPTVAQTGAAAAAAGAGSASAPVDENSKQSTAGAEPIGLSETALGRVAVAVAEQGRGPGRVGRYRLIEVVGEGGMGEVWRAEQEQPIRRTVALKLINPGMDTRQVVARFEAERQALALMNHRASPRCWMPPGRSCRL